MSVYVDLYWLPLGAGGHAVRANGRVYEAIAARVARRAPRDLYHAALEVATADGRFVIEMSPVRHAPDVVASGPVGVRAADRLRIFRYEVRRWSGGTIGDVAEAVDSPQRLTTDEHAAERVLDLVPLVPTPVWGRDELDTGDRWTSNSVVSWLLVRAGVDLELLRMPDGGRAPGWDAGVVMAQRQVAVMQERLAAIERRVAAAV